jgi:Arc/MetJ family transcription regulator
VRINVEVEDDLLTTAMKQTGLKTYRATLEEALRALIHLYREGEVRDLRGRLHREADLRDRRRS